MKRELNKEMMEINERKWRKVEVWKRNDGKGMMV